MKTFTVSAHRQPHQLVERLMSGPESKALSITNEESVPLATALAQWVAENAHIRLLILKGPLAHESGLRARKTSTDVDVLVLPSDVDRLISALAEHGWSPRPWPQFPTLLPPHSRALLHPQWGIDIDVHFNWPGFLAPASNVFDRLWERRREMTLAGTPVQTTGRADTALILALHLLREAPQKWNRGRTIPAYDDLIKRVVADDGLSADIRAAAADTGSEQTARPFLEAVGFEIPETEPDDALRAWRLHGASAHPVSGWLNAFADASIRERPSLVWRAVFPSAADLRAIDPAGGDGARGTFYRWWRRLKRGIRTAPAAIRTLRKEK
ncbi:nucleotidyltransferase family protein [Gulosibacter molinativorax]